VPLATLSLKDDVAMLLSGHPRGNAVRATLVPWLARSGLMLGAQQHESVLDAFFEDLIGELLVGQGAG
jgi:hypothetical protein